MLFSLLLVSPTLASDWSNNFQRPEKYDVVPVVDLGVESQKQNINVVTRFPNGCYEGWSAFKEVEGDQLTLYHVATYPDDSACPRIVTYNDITFSLQGLRPGTYEIVDGEDGAVLAQVKKTSESLRRLDK